VKATRVVMARAWLSEVIATLSLAEAHVREMRRQRKSPALGYETVNGHTYAASDPEPLPEGVAAWPIVSAYVPVRDVWRATGLGIAGVVRQRPDGAHESAFFMLDLYDHGLLGAFGKSGTLAEIDGLLVSSSSHLPPFERGLVELAAEFAWGARMFARSHGVEFPPAMERHFALMPRPEGASRGWLRRFAGPGGLTPLDLVRVLRENPPPEAVPEGKELVVPTEATFSSTDMERALVALRGTTPEFLASGSGESEVFTWERPDSLGRLNPLRLLGGRKTAGSVRVRSGRIVAQAQALSLMARLIVRLRKVVPGLCLEDCRWTTHRELDRRASAS